MHLFRVNDVILVLLFVCLFESSKVIQKLNDLNRLTCLL